MKKRSRRSAAYMFRDALGIPAFARRLQAPLVDIGGENLYPGSFFEGGGMLAAASMADRIGFLSGSATDNADAHLRVAVLALK